MPLVLIKGREDLPAGRYLRALAGADTETRRTEEIDAESFMWLMSGDLFSGRKMLLMETDTLKADNGLLRLLSENPVEGEAVLCIRARSVPSNTRLAKWLMQNAEVVDCEPLSERAYMAFLEREDERLRAGLGRENLRRLAERSRYLMPGSGVDLMTVEGWLEQLAVYAAAGGGIDADAIDAVVRTDEVNTAFEIVGALASRDPALAFRKAEGVRDAALRVLAALQYSLRVLEKLRFLTPEEAGVSRFQTRELRPLMSCTEEETDRMLDAVTEGMALCKGSVPDSEAMAQVLSRLCAVICKG